MVSIRGKRVIFLAMPGAGKSIMGKEICKYLKLRGVEIGSIVRKEIAMQTKLGVKMRSYCVSGQLVPDDVMQVCVERELLSRTGDKRGWLLDGFPRNINQARWLDDVARPDLVVIIDLPEWVALKKIIGRRVCSMCDESFNVTAVMEEGFCMPARLPSFETCPKGDSCPRDVTRRGDDSPEIAKQRMKTYQNMLQPLLDHYSPRLLTYRVKRGLHDIDDLAQTIRVRLGNILDGEL